MTISFGLSLYSYEASVLRIAGIANATSRCLFYGCSAFFLHSIKAPIHSAWGVGKKLSKFQLKCKEPTVVSVARYYWCKIQMSRFTTGKTVKWHGNVSSFLQMLILNQNWLTLEILLLGMLSVDACLEFVNYRYLSKHTIVFEFANANSMNLSNLKEIRCIFLTSSFLNFMYTCNRI